MCRQEDYEHLGTPRCWGTTDDGTPCPEPGTIADPEVPLGLFLRGDPVHCEAHHARLMARRAENEASWQRMVGGLR